MVAIQEDTTDTLKQVQDKRQESSTYLRQWTLWLGVGNGGGVIALMSLAANLPDPDYAFRVFLASMWFFLVGIILSALSLPVAARRAEAHGEHHASAHNRSQFRDAAAQIPMIISAPRSIAEGMNAPRDELIARAKAEHEQAEGAWTQRTHWHRSLLGLYVGAALCFAAGVAWPLLYVSAGGSLTGGKTKAAAALATPTGGQQKPPGKASSR